MILKRDDCAWCVIIAFLFDDGSEAARAANAMIECV
jgi:hypothetical protein